MSKLFDKEESIKLMRSAQKGCRASKNKIGLIIDKIIKYVWRHPRWRNYYGDVRDDMNSNAWIWCAKNINKWDENKGCSPYTWFYNGIWQQFTLTSIRYKTLGNTEIKKIINNASDSFLNKYIDNG